MKPSFGQVLGYIQEGEPLALDLPKRNASIYTSSHFYLNNFPNASEPLSDAPMPHTTLNPAAAFETADEGYEGVPFPRPPREFTRPSFLPDSDDGGTDPGQALRNDGLNPPRPPTLGGRMRESGIQAAEAIVAGGAAGAAASGAERVGEPECWPCEVAATGWTGPFASQIIGRPSEVEPLLQRAGQRAAEVERAAAQDIESFASQQLAEAEASEGFATAAEAAAGAAEAATAAEAGTGALALLGEGALATAGTVGAAAGGLAVAGAGAALVGTAWAIEGGLNAASRLMGWGAATRGGTDSDASRPEHDHGRAEPERDARKRSRGSLLHPGAAEGPAEPAGGLQDRHGVGERAQESAAATDPKLPGEASEATGANPLRPEQRSHPRVLRQRTVPGQPPVPRRPGTPRNPAVLRRPSSGERTGTCIR